jgi:hypothetical protein
MSDKVYYVNLRKWQPAQASIYQALDGRWFIASSLGPGYSEWMIKMEAKRMVKTSMGQAVPAGAGHASQAPIA